MRVLQVIESLTRGGAERLVIELSRELKNRGVEAGVLCLSSPGPWSDGLEAEGLHAACLQKKPGLDLRLIPRLMAAIRRARPDIVQSHLFTANLWTRLVSLGSRPWRMVVTLHNVDSWRGPLHVLADRMLAGVPDAYVAVSDSVAQYYRQQGLGDSRLRVIPNGIHSNGAPAYLPLSRSTPLIRACGRLVANKGFGFLISAAAILRDKGTRFRMEIVGEGPERRALETAIWASNLEGLVSLEGDRDDARQLIADADIFALPSTMEGLPLVVLEALHAARPVVATDIPALHGVVDNGATGLVVPAGSASALAAAIESLISAPARARSMGLAGRECARRDFSIEKTAASYLELYSRLLDNRP